MTLLEIILLAICVVLLIVLLAVLIKSRLDAQRITRLTQSIENYLENGKFTSFSTREDRFSVLQNAVCDLENALEHQKHSTFTETKKNSDFIADVSHQFKTPIAALRLYVEMDNANNPSDHTKKELQLIEKMEQLIAKLLQLEKLQADTYSMNFDFCSVEAMIGSIVADFKPIYSRKKFIINGSAQMRCDKEWLTEAIGNVIKNACEHTADEGEIVISIDAGEKSTIITVSDNGGGVKAEELPKLFNRFHRTENAKPQSAGIGLAITKAIVQKHHGTISAENTAKGLSIIMCFPKIDGAIAI